MQNRYFEVTGQMNNSNFVIFRAARSGKARSFQKQLQLQPTFNSLKTREIITGTPLRTGLVFDKAGAQ
jgi:hypothetical protein